MPKESFNDLMLFTGNRYLEVHMSEANFTKWRRALKRVGIELEHVRRSRWEDVQ